MSRISYVVLLSLALASATTVIAMAIKAPDASSPCQETATPLVTATDPAFVTSDRGVVDQIRFRAGTEITMEASLHACDWTASEYRWHIRQGFSDADLPDLQTLHTEQNRMTHRFDAVGVYEIYVDHLDAMGDVVRSGLRDIGLEANATVVKTADLPADGSTFRFTFDAFCCPGETKARLRPPSGVFLEPHDIRLLGPDGQLLADERNVLRVPPDVYRDAYGSWFMESFTIEVEPSEAVRTPTGYQVEIAVGLEP